MYSSHRGKTLFLTSVEALLGVPRDLYHHGLKCALLLQAAVNGSFHRE